MSKKKAEFFQINYEQTRVIEEDEIAEIKVIFDSLDFGKRGRVTTNELPTILRLLQHNVGEEEEKGLRFEIDRKNKGYFTLKELVTLLEKYSFKEDTQAGLLEAFAELDQDADGFIEADELCDYLRSVGEPFTDEEMGEFVKLARDESSDRPKLICIKRLTDILLPKIGGDNALTRGVKKDNNMTPQESRVEISQVDQLDRSQISQK